MKKKNMFRITAVLMVCVMMLSCMSFAADSTAYYDGHPIAHSCNVGYSSADASTSYPPIGIQRSVSLSVAYQYIEDETPTRGGTSDYASANSGTASAHCGFVNSHWAMALSDHSADGWSGSLSDEIGTEK